MWKFLEIGYKNYTMNKNILVATTAEELIELIEEFRNLNMIAGGHDPFQDTEYSIVEYSIIDDLELDYFRDIFRDHNMTSEQRYERIKKDIIIVDERHKRENEWQMV